MSEQLFDLTIYGGDKPERRLATGEGVWEDLHSLGLTYKVTDSLHDRETVIVIRPHIDETKANELQARLDQIGDLAHGS